MRLNLTMRAVVLAAGLFAAIPAISQAATGGLPPGLAIHKSDEGLVLSKTDGAPLYRLDLDRLAKRLRGYADIMARCADTCPQYWRPVVAPAGFQPEGDWSLVQRGGEPILAYKGDPLYTFAGKSFDEIAARSVVPSFMTGYAGEPTVLADGVPAATLYWHLALYQPPAPKVTAPAGVATQWSKVAYVFADAAKHDLYVARSGRVCAGVCDGLKPLAAPLVADAVGDWRPLQDKSGARYWAYRGRIVYQVADAKAAEPGPEWQALEIR